MEDKHPLLQSRNSTEMSDQKKKTIKVGLALFMLPTDQKLGEDIYFEDKLPRKYKNNFPLTPKIHSLRNILIVLTIIEIFSALLGLSFYLIRRSILYLVINGVAIAVAILGVVSSVYILEIGLVIYTLITTSVPGTFFVFQIVELCTIGARGYDIEKEKTKENSPLGDSVLLGIFSIPYIYDFFVGIFSFYFMTKIAEFNETYRGIDLNQENHNVVEAGRNVDDIEMKNEIARRQNQADLCIICLEKKRNAITQPCNHLITCMECYEQLNRDVFHGKTCPICRQSILSVINFDEAS